MSILMFLVALLGGDAMAEGGKGKAKAAKLTEVGTDKKFGIGVSVGYPHYVTGKYWLDSQGGVAFYAGGSILNGVTGRVQYERQFINFMKYDKLGRLDMFWSIGAVGGLGGGSLVPGAGGGVGAELRFKKVPAAVHHDTMFYTYPTQWKDSTGTFGPTGHVRVTSALGGRWYF